jgi:hypothetical protein
MLVYAMPQEMSAKAASEAARMKRLRGIFRVRGSRFEVSC